MYIFELIVKLFNKKPKKTKVLPSADENEFGSSPAPTSVDEVGTCEHIFYPIDSTGKILACSKCGELLKK